MNRLAPARETVDEKSVAGRSARMSGCDRWALMLLATGTAAFLPLALNRFATLASYDITGAADEGAPWATKELAAHPNSVQALMDMARIDLARNERAGARRLLLRALGLEPANAELRTQAVRMEQAGSGPAHQS